MPPWSCSVREHNLRASINRPARLGKPYPKVQKYGILEARPDAPAGKGEIMPDEAMKEKIRESVDSKLCNILEDLDELGSPLTEREARIYFAAERYLFPENEAFRPENIKETERKYLTRASAS